MQKQTLQQNVQHEPRAKQNQVWERSEAGSSVRMKNGWSSRQSPAYQPPRIYPGLFPDRRFEDHNALPDDMYRNNDEIWRGKNTGRFRQMKPQHAYGVKEMDSSYLDESMDKRFSMYEDDTLRSC